MKELKYIIPKMSDSKPTAGELAIPPDTISIHFKKGDLSRGSTWCPLEDCHFGGRTRYLLATLQRLKADATIEALEQRLARADEIITEAAAHMYDRQDVERVRELARDFIAAKRLEPK